MTDLPSFPVDDATLSAVEHALGGSLTFDRPADADPDDDGPWRIGADYSLSQLLDFLAGISHHPDAEAIHMRLVDPGDSTRPGWEGAPVYVDDRVHYSEHDLIRALVGEIRRLRAEARRD